MLSALRKPDLGTWRDLAGKRPKSPLFKLIFNKGRVVNIFKNSRHWKGILKRKGVDESNFKQKASTKLGYNNLL